MKLISLLASIVIATTGYAAAQEAARPAPQQFKCYRREELTKQLMSARHSPIMAATTDDGKLFEIWSDGANWVSIVTETGGLSCPTHEGSDGIKPQAPICIDPVHCPRI